MNKYKHLLFIFVLGLTTNLLWGQDSTAVREVVYDTQEAIDVLEFEEKTIQDFREDDDFNYEEVIQEESWWSQFKEWLSDIWLSFWEWLLGDYQVSPFWSFFVAALPYVIIAFLIGFIIWLFIKLNPNFTLLKKKEVAEVFYTEEEEIIKSKNIKLLIENALKDGNYRLAVRYYYLLILKNLTEAKLIEYEFEKTNSDYAKEIQETTINSTFQKVTLLYDNIWYGNFTVGNLEFNQVQQSFQKLEQQIKQL